MKCRIFKRLRVYFKVRSRLNKRFDKFCDASQAFCYVATEENGDKWLSAQLELIEAQERFKKWKLL